MNVLEMHIALQQAVDKINSLRANNLQPEERDLELNKAMQRFINQRYGKNNIYGKGFEESQKRIDELRTLLVEYAGPTTFKEELRNGKIWVDTFQLPVNYMYLVNQRSTICINKCMPLRSSLVATPVLNYFTFSLTSILVSNNTFVDSIRMQNVPQGNTPTLQETIWQPSAGLISSGYTSSGYPQYTQQVIDDVLNNPMPGFEIHYGSYGTLSFPGQFIVIVDINTQAAFWFEWDASINTPTPLVSMIGTGQIASVQPQAYDTGTYTRVPIGPCTKDQVLNRFSQQDDIFKLLEDPFNTTSHKEPLTTIRGGNIDIYTSAIFITEAIKITYLRKPLPISISLGSSCELPEHTHEEIVSMAASSILEKISDPRYQTNLGELLNRE
jgi:hypothetical protein